MKVALLAWTALEPADRGYRIRTQAILKYLPAEQLLALSPSPKIPGMNHTILPRPWITHIPLPFNSEIFQYHRGSKASHNALRALHDFKPDLLWSEGLWSFPAAWRYHCQTGTPLLMGVQNIESIAAERNGKPTFRSTLLKRKEQQVYPKCAILVTCSESDAELLKRQFGISKEKILILPNGIHPFQTFTEKSLQLRQKPEEKILLFIGKLDYGPNREALNWIRHQLEPELRKLPDAICIAIVGEPRPENLSVSGSSSGPIRWIATGYVPKIGPYLEAADICLAPLFSGSGTRIKILEYLSSGKPVVATSKAVEGIDLQAGRHFELAENAPDMAKKIKQLLDHPEASMRMAKLGKREVEEKYSWEKLIQNFYSQLENFLH